MNLPPSDPDSDRAVLEPGALAPALASPADARAGAPRAGTPLVPRPRPRGRPLEMQPDAVLEMIRTLAAEPDGLFRVHRSRPALYARARRLFGTWGAAVRLAGVDYGGLIEIARARSLRARRAAGPAHAR